MIAAERGQFADEVLLAERALAQFAEEDDVRAEGLLRTTLAWMLLDAPQRDPDQAQQLLTDAHTRLAQAGMQIELAYTETELARAHTLLGDPDQAIRWARSSLERLGDTDRLETARARLALAHALLLNDETSAAIEEMQQAADGLQHTDASRQGAAVWRDLGQLFVTMGTSPRPAPPSPPPSTCSAYPAMFLTPNARQRNRTPLHPANSPPRQAPPPEAQPPAEPSST